MRISGFFFKAGWLAVVVVAVLIIRLVAMSRSAQAIDIQGKVEGIYAVVGIVCVSWAIGAIAKVIESRKAPGHRKD